jgi:hypothetical protein
MTDIGSNPFAEPDFSAFRTSGTEDELDEVYGDADIEDEFDDEDDDLDEGEEFDDAVDIVVETVVESDAGTQDDANRLAGGTARSVLEHVARSIVDDPEGVAVDVAETRSGVHLSLHVAQGDMGRIIGRRGRTAQALRTLVRAAAARDNQEASVDIVD